MARKALYYTIAVTASVAAIALALFFAQQEYEATCGLAYGHRVGGNIYYALENDGNSTAYDQLVNMRKVWLSPDLRSRVCKRVRAECANASTNDMINAIASADVEIRLQKVSVLVKVTAPSKKVAITCAKAFSEEIIDSTAVQGQKCKERGVNQVKRNCEKQERYVASLRRKLYQLKTEKTCLEAAELKDAEARLLSQERILESMKMDVTKLQSDDSWCGFFVEMGDIVCRERSE